MVAICDRCLDGFHTGCSTQPCCCPRCASRRTEHGHKNNVHQRKLTEADAHLAWHMLESGGTLQECADRLRVVDTSIVKLLKRYHMPHIPSKPGSGRPRLTSSWGPS